MITPASTRRVGFASLLLAATTMTLIAGCAAGTGDKTTAGANPSTSADPGGVGKSGDRPADAETTADPVVNPTTTKKSGGGGTHTTSPTPTKWEDSGPRIVSFKVVQKPKCAEGTAVFRSEPVSLIIKWKITGADSGALSVDDNSHTPGTYGPVALEGSEEFRFSCGGPVGTVETHKYQIYTVGGGDQKVKTIHVSAKVLDKGKLASS
jgi:hypothetical protein